MSLNKVFKVKMWRYEWVDTFAQLHGTHNPNKKLSRRLARKRMKQDKFYNGFYEFVEENKKRRKEWESKEQL